MINVKLIYLALAYFLVLLEIIDREMRSAQAPPFQGGVPLTLTGLKIDSTKSTQTNRAIDCENF